MKLPALKIANLVAKIPIIQGGMAVRISTSTLAAAVAEEGGIGLIAATGMSVEELRYEIRRARKLTSGIIGINIMFAVREFALLVKTAIEEKIDLVVQGAGFSRDIFTWGKKSNTPIVSIVSSAKLAKIAQKLGAAALVVEGKEAGGHLGTDRPMKELVPEVRKVVDIPIIAAGGIVNGQHIVEAFQLGADGVQMGTRFAASAESGASDAFKQLYLQANDTVLIESPVGLPGRAITNNFVQQIVDNKPPKPLKCDKCLKNCNYNYCILGALNNAQQGNLNEGLVFAGENVAQVKEVLPAKEIIARLKQEVNSILGD